jgi:deoxyguanosine kinase
MYIVVEGNIGAGKTSLVHLLCERLGASPMLEEFAENSFLPRFYENPEKFAFPLELSFLAARFHQMNNVFNKTENQFIIADYHFEKCKIFASVNLPPLEFELFSTFYDMMAEKLPKPDLIVFLNSDIERLESNISLRGRSYEQTIGTTYLYKISEAYQGRINTIKSQKALIIKSSDLDFVNNTEHLNQIIREVTFNLAL